MNEENPSELLERHPVMQKIENREIKMHSKMFFVSRSLILVIFALALFVVVILFSSFVVSLFRLTGTWVLSPWLALALSLVLIYFVGALLSRYAFIYLRPALMGAAALIITLGIATLVAQQLTTHTRFACIYLPCQTQNSLK